MRNTLRMAFLAFAVMGLSILIARAEPFQGPRKSDRHTAPADIYSRSLQDIEMGVLNQAVPKLVKTVNEKSKEDPLVAPYMIVSQEGEGYQVKLPATRQDSTSLVFDGVGTVAGLQGKLLPGEFNKWAAIASTKTKELLKSSLQASDKVAGAIVTTDGLVIPVSDNGTVRYDLALEFNHPEVSPVPSVLEVVKNLRSGRTSEPTVGDNSSYSRLRQVLDQVENPKPLVKLREPVLDNSVDAQEPEEELRELRTAPRRIKSVSED